MANKDYFDFREIARLEAGSSPNLINVIEKELIHHDILRTMTDNGFMSELCFQGGTSLRLCYQSERFSEDLDFTGGLNYTASNMAQLKICLEDTLTKKYGLLVEVKPPKEKKDPDINVSTWQVKVVTAPDRPDIPTQKIKIEIANIPSYTREFSQINDFYQTITYSPLLVPVQSMEEIMSDKLLALPASVSNIRYRDLWDLNWMSTQRVKPNLDLLQSKISDYQVENYHEKLNNRIDSLPALIEGLLFRQQMSRFLRYETMERTVSNPEFRQAMLLRLTSMLTQCQELTFVPSQKFRR